MIKKINVLCLLTVLFGPASFAGTNADKDRESLAKKTYALVVCGISKDPQDQSNKSNLTSVIQKFFLTIPEISGETLIALTPGSPAANDSDGLSTADNIQKAIKTTATAIRPDDRFILYYLGQANTVGEQLRLNLPGTDITQEQLARWITDIKASSMLIVLDCPGAALAAKALSGRGRIVLCGCMAEQRYCTRFSEYFIPAFTNAHSDTNSDGRISILEAFTSASRQIDDWYRQKKLLTTETPVLEDNGDGVPSSQPWRFEIDEKDGFAASDFFLSRS